MATHEGWKNYATWCVNLWLDNDQGLYLAVKEQAEGLSSSATDGNDRDGAKADMASWLKDFVTEMAPSLEGLWSDLLTATLGEVDWDEIAGQKIDEAIEEAA